MTALVFLGIVVGIAVIGSVVIALRNRPSAGSDDGVATFSALMDELAPPVRPDDQDEL